MSLDQPTSTKGSALDLDHSLRNLLAPRGGYSDEQISTLLTSIRSYLAELALWNPKLGLVESLADVVPRHVLDCLAPIPVFSTLLEMQVSPGVPLARVKCADLGTGAGLPGLLLSLVFPQYSWDLVESMGRRVSFLENAKIMVPGAGFRIVPKPFEQLAAQSYNLITNRAFQPLDLASFKLQTELLLPGGVAVWYKGRYESIEEESKKLKLQLVHGQGSRTETKDQWVHLVTSDGLLVLPYTVPGLDAERHLVVWKKP